MELVEKSVWDFMAFFPHFICSACQKL